MTVDEIREVLQNWFAERTGTIDADRRYAEMSEIDSFDVLQLVLFSENTFGIKFSGDDFASSDFATLTGMARLIHSRIR